METTKEQPKPVIANSPSIKQNKKQKAPIFTLNYDYLKQNTEQQI